MSGGPPFPFPPHSLPGFEPLVGGDLWQRWSAAGVVFPVADLRAACRYLRFKPETQARLYIAGADRHSADEPPEGMMLSLFPDLPRAKEAYAKEMTRKHAPGGGGFGPFLCEESAIIGVPFPNDPEIPDLRHLYHPDRFRRTLGELLPDYEGEEWRIQRSLTSLALLAYKPGRRAVYRIKVKIRRRVGDEKVRVKLHIKVENPRTCARSFENLRAVHAAVPPGAAWRVPSPMGQPEGRTLMAAEWVEGEPLSARASDAESTEIFRRVGEALAGFHRLPIELDHLASPVEEGDQLVQHARDLAELLPARGAEIRALGAELATQVSRFALSPSSTTHGDFRVDQVIVGDPGPAIIDLDRAGRGYAANDIGTFLAHLCELGSPPSLAAAFLAGYREASEVEIPEDWIQVARAAALFRRAGFPFRELRPSWPEELAARLAAAERELVGLPR